MGRLSANSCQSQKVAYDPKRTVATGRTWPNDTDGGGCLAPEATFSPNIVLEANSIAILNNVVKQCRLATILPDAIVREQAGSRELRTIPSLPGRTVVLYRRNNGYHSVAADAFAKLVSVLRTRVCRIAWAKIVGSGSIASRPL
jgi:DNA-binding transcriptional LysR family regulator